MKTLKITTDNKISIVDVDFKDFRSIQQAVGGYFETVKTRKMWDYFKAPVIMLVDEEGLIKGLSCNAVASAFYGIEEHGCMIAGDAIFGEAIKYLKRGMKVTRKGWNGKKQYIQLATGISYVSAEGELVNCEHEAIGNKAVAFVGTSGVQLGWLASQADMLAEDWVFVNAI